MVEKWTGEPSSHGEERRQREYYNEIAGLYDRHHTSAPALKYRYWVYDQALKALPLDGKTALDAMCGGGEGTGYLLGRGADVTGLDISDECCRIYRDRYPQAKAVRSSILDTGLPSGHFDLVLTDSLHHLHPRLDEGIAEIHRLLKPGGHLCCWEPVARTLPDRLRRLWYHLDRRFFLDNERAVDIAALARDHRERFLVVKTVYGGNVAYLLVTCSMALRIPPGLVNVYAPAVIGAEKLLSRIQPRFLSLWVLSLLRKPLKT